MAKVVVFGGGGYVGIPLCNELKLRGYDVLAVDRFFFDRTPDVPCLKGDTRSVQLDLSKCSVIDVAGLSNDASSEIDPTLTTQINVDGGRRIASMAKEAGVRRYIYSSSASVYGHGSKMYLTESDPVNPLTAYAKSKAVMEQHFGRIAGDGFEPVILRNATIFGVAPRMRFDLAINVMVMRAWKDKRILVMGGGQQFRPFVHIRDVVDVFCKMLELPAHQVAGKTFNVGSDVMNFNINQIAGLVKQHFRDAELIRVPDDTDQRTYHVSFKRLREVGIDCTFGIDFGIKEIRAALDAGTINGDDPTAITLSWYKQIISWEKKLDEMRLDGKVL